MPKTANTTELITLIRTHGHIKKMSLTMVLDTYFQYFFCQIRRFVLPLKYSQNILTNLVLI